MRIEVPSKIRKKILTRNNGYCEVCNIFKSIEVHHIIPLCDGGEGAEDNLSALCGFCHDNVPGHYPDGYKEEFNIYKLNGGKLWCFFRMGLLAKLYFEPMNELELIDLYNKIDKYKKLFIKKIRKSKISCIESLQFTLS